MPSQDIVEIKVLSDPRNLSVVRAAVDAAASRFGLEDGGRDKLVLAVDEALTNVIRHGYGGRTDLPIHVTLSPVQRDGQSGIQVTIEDECQHVDVDKIRRRSLAEVKPGGLGVNIIYESVDEVDYQPRRDCCGLRLTLRKFQNRPKPA